MVPIFNYKHFTESIITLESLFNDLKTDIFKYKTLPLRIDHIL